MSSTQLYALWELKRRMEGGLVRATETTATGEGGEGAGGGHGMSLDSWVILCDGAYLGLVPSTAHQN